MLVLPFRNSAGEEHEHLADGLSETLIHRLSQAGSLRVIARGTAFSFKNKECRPEEMGRELNVSLVLSGSVARVGEAWILNAEVVDAGDGAQVWGARYTRSISELIAVTDHIAQEMIRTLHLPVSRADRERMSKPPTLSSQAYLLYLKGLYQFHRLQPEALLESIRYFEQAVAKDPTYAEAYAGLARTYAFLGIGYGDLPPRDILVRSDAAARKAAELDETLADAHWALAWSTPYRGFDLDFAAREFHRAIELNPSDPLARIGYAYCLSSRRCHEQAIAEGEVAVTLDPRSYMAWTECAYFYAAGGRAEDALRHVGRALQLEPAWAAAHYVQGWAYLLLGRQDDAVAALEHAVSLSLLHTVPLGLLGYAYAVTGEEASARQILAKLDELSQTRHVSRITESLVWVGLGDHEKALAALEGAYEHREPFLYMVHSWTWFDRLRSEPRFQQLERSIGVQGESAVAGHS